MRVCKIFFMKRGFGFTLIELVMVIVILGIIAAITLPKFANFKTNAIERSEDYIAGSINTAIKIYNTSYLTAGGDPSAYSSVNPFTLLAQAPANKIYWSPDGNPTLDADGVTWGSFNYPAFSVWYISCPHRNGTVHGLANPSKGRWWIYKYAESGAYTQPYGTFWLASDLHH